MKAIYAKVLAASDTLTICRETDSGESNMPGGNIRFGDCTIARGSEVKMHL